MKKGHRFLAEVLVLSLLFGVIEPAGQVLASETTGDIYLDENMSVSSDEAVFYDDTDDMHEEDADTSDVISANEAAILDEALGDTVSSNESDGAALSDEAAIKDEDIIDEIEVINLSDDADSALLDAQGESEVKTIEIGVGEKAKTINSVGAGDEIFELDKKEPINFGDPANPYCLNRNEEMFLSTNNELMLYQTYNVDKKDQRKWATWFSGWGGEGKSLTLSQKKWNDKGGFDEVGDYGATTHGYSFIQSVPFSPSGDTKRKDHVAYIGYNDDDYTICVWVYDTRTKETQSDVWTYTMSDGKDNWIRKDVSSKWYKKIRMLQYEAANFFAITAGDYDGDGRDSIVAYIPDDGDKFGLVELEYNVQSKKITSQDGKSERSNLLHARYTRSGDRWRTTLCNDKNRRNKLSCRLTTGDLNNDKIDDLAVLSYIGRPYERDRRTNGDPEWANKIDAEFYSPYLAVALGKKDSRILYDNITDGKYIRKELEVGEDDDFHKYDTMIAPGFDAGDINGDGCDEIVIAGFKNTVQTFSRTNYKSRIPFKIDEDTLCTAVCRFDTEGNQAFSIGSIDANGWLKGGTYFNLDDVWAPMVVKCVAFNGFAAPKHVFIGGTICDFEGGILKEIYTGDYFTKSDDGGDGYLITNTYLASAAVGNFDKNIYGYEQIIFSVGLKQEAYNDYIYFLGMIGGKNYDGKGGTVGSNGNSKSKFYYTSGDYVIDKARSGYVDDGRVNCVVTAIDRDNDGTLIRYIGKDYMYTDPQVVAVLQAAPYFGELGKTVGATDYSMSESNTYEVSEGDSGSWGVGVSSSLDVKECFTANLTVKYVGSYGQTFKDSFTHTATTSIKATGKSAVIVKRTPVFIYVYEVFDKETGKWGRDSGKPEDEQCVAITLLQQPTYYQLSIDDYNKFVAAYNEQIKDVKDAYKLEKIDRALLASEGNPWGYTNSLDPLTNQELDLSYTPGSQTLGISDSKSHSVTETESHGVSVDLAIQFCTPLTGFKVGPALSGSYMKTNTTTKTNVSATGTNGTVTNLDMDSLKALPPFKDENKGLIISLCEMTNQFKTA